MANKLQIKRGLVAGIPTGSAGEPLFTTDTNDLYIGTGSANIKFQKYIASGATTQILLGDGSLYSFPLAISSPSNGQVLKYNGTSWVNDSDAGLTGSGTTNEIAYFTGATTLGSLTTATYPSLTELSYVKGVTSAIQTQLNAKEPTLTKGNLTEATSSVLTISGGTGAVIGSGTTIQVKQASGSQSGFLSSTDWTTFNNKLTLPSLTSGSVLFSNGTTIAQDNANFFWDDTNNRLGIGTASPAVVLDVASASATIRATSTTGTNTSFATFTNTGGAVRVGAENSSGGGLLTGTSAYSGVIGTTGAYPLSFGTNSTERMRLDASGNLGLGVTPSAIGSSYKVLQIGNSLTLMGASAAAEIGNNNFFNGTNYIYQTSSQATLYAMSAGLHRWYLAPSGTAGNAITFTQAMTLTANGDLLLSGTNNPHTVSNRGNITLNGSSGNIIAFTNGSTQQGYILHQGAQLALFNQRNDAITFGTNSTEVMRLTGGGNLLVGSTTDSGEKLQVTGTAKITGALSIGGATTFSGSAIFNSGTVIRADNGTAAAPSYTFDGDTNTGMYRISSDTIGITTAGTEKIRIDLNGNLGIATTSPSYKLHVVGTIYSNQSSGSGALLNGSTYGALIIGGTWGTYASASTGVAIAGESVSDYSIWGKRIPTSTNTILGVGRLYRGVSDISTYTPATGLGGSLDLVLDSSTTTERLASAIKWSWTTATDATRTSKVTVSTINSGTENIELEISSSGLKTTSPTGGTAQPFKVGQYNASAPSATGYVEIEINGVLYKLLAST